MSAASLYVDAGTPLHHLTGRTKLALAVGVSIAATIFTDPIAILAILTAALGVLLYAGGYRNLRRIWYIVVALVLVGLFVWPAFTPPRGPTVIDLPGLQLTMYELRLALGRSSRVATYLIVGLGFVTTTSNEELVSALRSLGLPYAFCFALGTALRLFPTFLGAANTVRQAQAARGHQIGATNPVKRLRNYVPLLIPVFMTAFRNVQTQSMALEARGFDTRHERTFYNRQRFGVADWIALGVTVAIVVAAVGLAAVGIGTL